MMVPDGCRQTEIYRIYSSMKDRYEFPTGFIWFILGLTSVSRQNVDSRQHWPISELKHGGCLTGSHYTSSGLHATPSANDDI